MTKGPLHTPGCIRGFLWTPVLGPRGPCVSRVSCQAGSTCRLQGVQFRVPVRLSSVSFTEGLG